MSEGRCECREAFNNAVIFVLDIRERDKESPLVVIVDPGSYFLIQMIIGVEKDEPDREVIRETTSPRTISLAGKDRDPKKKSGAGRTVDASLQRSGAGRNSGGPPHHWRRNCEESLPGFFSCTGSCFALCWFGLLWLRFRYALFLCGFNHLRFQLPLSDGFWLYRVDRDDNEMGASIRFLEGMSGWTRMPVLVSSPRLPFGRGK